MNIANQSLFISLLILACFYPEAGSQKAMLKPLAAEETSQDILRSEDLEPLDDKGKQLSSESVIRLSRRADVYTRKGKYREAEALYIRALAIWEAQVGLDHPNIALGLNNLAELYRAERYHELAEPLHLRALALREKLLGPNHPEVAASLKTLAELYRDQNKHHEAEIVRKRSVEILEKALGPSHP